MTEQPDSKFANTLLSPELQADLELIQAHHAITNRSDAIRMLIRKEARRIQLLEPATIPGAEDCE